MKESTKKVLFNCQLQVPVDENYSEDDAGKIAIILEEALDTANLPGSPNFLAISNPLEIQEDLHPLLSAVIDQISEDIRYGDLEALEELLNFIPRKYLIGYLTEVEAPKFLPKKYYQPDFDDIKFKHDLMSFMVYQYKENAERDFPDTKILEYQNDDIEDPTFIDW